MRADGLVRVSILLGAVALTAGCSGSRDATIGGADDAATSEDAASVVDGGDLSDSDGGADAAADVGPTTADRLAAASATATSNALCVVIKPFYWEIGDQNAPLASASVAGSGNTTYGADTVLPIASASKWLYSAYWVQRTNGVLTSEDIKFFNLWSGYTHFSSCKNATTVGGCLDIANPDGTTNGQLDPTTEGKFDYGGGHMQKHAALNGLVAMDNAALAAEIRAQLGTDIAFTYNEPQLAGGASISAAEYAKMLRKILGGKLVMSTVLGTHRVCTNPAHCKLAVSSPTPPGEQWSYSIGHWVEDDPNVGDGAFSSPGAFGFYPWIDATKTLYGIVARKDLIRGAFESVNCGRLIRKAWVTGIAQ